MAQITLGAGFLNLEKKELGLQLIRVIEKHNINSIDTSIAKLESAICSITDRQVSLKLINIIDLSSEV